MNKPQFSIKRYKDKYTVDVKMDSIYIDKNWWWHFHFKPHQIKSQIQNEFADLDNIF